jgi:hypothetical protein
MKTYQPGRELLERRRPQHVGQARGAIQSGRSGEWIALYTELVGINERLMLEIQQTFGGMPSPPNADLHAADACLFRNETRRLRARLNSWSQVASVPARQSDG